MMDGPDEEESNDTENWVQWYRKQIELNPKSTVARYKLGRLLAKAERYEEAVVEWKSVIALDPNHLAARVAIEEAYSKMKRRPDHRDA
jgi:lipopolysaccharide biosynthesis regulator YciM